MTLDHALVKKATEYATEQHHGQSRKDEANTPYINHPIALANLLTNFAGVTDTNVIVAALLHDTVEDTSTTVEDIEELFGTKIRDIVMEDHFEMVEIFF